MKKVFILLSLLIILLVFFSIFAHTFVFNLFSGRVDFPEEYVGENLKMEDGQIFVVFRRLKVADKSNSTDDLAVFKVRFKFKSLKFGTNKLLSMIPTPFLVGMKGFREKFWTINENKNDFQGIYQFSSKEMAERYPDTFIFKAMTKRAAPETLSYEIIPNTDLSKYISTIRDK